LWLTRRFLYPDSCGFQKHNKLPPPLTPTMSTKQTQSSTPSQGPTARRQRNRASKKLRKSVTDCLPPDGVVNSGFGQRGSTDAEKMIMLYQPRSTAGTSSTGAVTTKRELSIRLTDFFDYTVYDATAGAIPQDVTHYSFNCNQNLFNNAPTAPGDLTTTFCRVRGVTVWVLPVKGFTTEADTTNVDNAAGMFTVNCQTPGAALGFGRTTLASSTVALATDTQVTNVTPQFDTKWKQVFHCNLQKTFQSGVIRPYFRSGGVVGTEATQCLFSMSIADPVGGKSYLSATATETLAIRVKVQLIVDQPISTFQRANLSVFRNEDFTLPFFEQNGTAYPGTVDSYVQMDLKGAVDNMR
jgi:hypothetical protein